MADHRALTLHLCADCRAVWQSRHKVGCEHEGEVWFSKTEEVEVVPAEHLAGAVDEAAERIFASGILDEIAESDGGDGRDAMADAVAIARVAFGGR